MTQHHDRHAAPHPSDDDLILHFYREHLADRAAQIDAHLSSCQRCYGTWVVLQQTMTLVDAAPVPDPAPDFERQLWVRIEDRLPTATKGWTWRQVSPVAAMAATVVLAIGLTDIWRLPADPPAPAGDTTRHERVLFTALDGHLERAELLLTELLNQSPASAGDVELDFERIAADELITSGRLYRATAVETGDVGLVAMLEDLESVLVEVARSPDRVAREDWESLRTWIGDEDLLFKVRAAANEVRVRQNSLLTVSEGPL